MIEYLIIRDQNRAKVAILDLFESVIWARSYYSTGDFEIYAPATEDNLRWLKVGNYVTRDDDDEVGIIENIEFSYTTAGGLKITAGGRFAKSLLDRRLIYRLTGKQNAPTVIRGNVEKAARSLVNNNIIAASDTARNISFIKLGAEAGIDKTIVTENGEAGDKQTTYENLLSYTDELLQEYEIGARMTLNDDNDLIYRVYEGADRRANNTQGNDAVIFSQQFDNLKGSRYTHDESTAKTTALVGGAGENLERFYTLYGGNASGEERREVFIDAQSVDKKYKDESDVEKEYTDAVYRQMLQTKARQELAQLTAEETFTGDVEVQGTQYHYKTDFNLGDLVTITDETMGLAIGARITHITEVQDGAGYAVELKFNS